MTRFLVLTFLLAAAAPALADGAAVGKGARQAAAPKRFFLKPPKGFRPSDAIDRLADVLGYRDQRGVYRWHDQLTPRIGKDGPELEVHLSLLDSKVVHERNGATHVLRFAKDYGFSITTDGDHAALKQALKPHGVDHLVIEPAKN